MSDVDDDLEFYTALEDELYKENASFKSDDEIDSELEAELYRNIHFASSFVTTSSENEEVNKTEPESSTRESNFCITKTTSGSIWLADSEGGNGTSKYPEVELMFSNEKKNPKGFKFKGNATLLNTNWSTNPGGHNAGDGFTATDDWQLDEADLMPTGSGSDKKKGKSSRILCINCNERGHRTFECTQPKKERVCHLCGRLGHLKRECPNELCFNCLEPGHQLRQCPKARCRPGETCRRCRMYGHFESLCPDKWRQYHLTIKQGHIITSKLQSEPVERQVYCYNCGEEGHLGHECWESRTDGRIAGSFPFVVRYDKFTAGSPRDSRKHKLDHHNGQYPRHNNHERQHVCYEDGEKLPKRRKTEYQWHYEGQHGDLDWDYGREHWKMKEEPLNRSDHWRNNGFTEVPEVANGIQRNTVTRKERRKKTKKKTKKKAKLHREKITVMVTEDKNKNNGRKHKKRKRTESDMNVCNNGDAQKNGYLNTSVKATKKKTTKRNKRRKKVNEMLAPNMNSNSSDTFYTKVRSNGKKAKLNGIKENGFVHSHPHKKTEYKKNRKSKKRKTKKANDSRIVYYDFNGFV